MVPKMASNGNTPASRETGKVIPPTPFQQMIRAMANDASAETEAFSGDDLNAILSAESEADIWDADDRPPLNFQHLSGCTIGIMNVDVKFSRSGNDEIRTPFVWVNNDGVPKKMYLMVKAVMIAHPAKKTVIKLPDVGEVFQANTSARYVVAKIWRFLTIGKIDEDRGAMLECFVEETDLGNGEAVIKLRQPAKQTVQA